MTITKQIVAERLAAYIHHELSIGELVDWAERAMMDGEFETNDVAELAAVVARLGVADARAFGLTWEDCEDLLRRVGYQARVEIVSA